jgi:hypothetical protein
MTESQSPPEVRPSSQEIRSDLAAVTTLNDLYIALDTNPVIGSRRDLFNGSVVRGIVEDPLLDTESKSNKITARGGLRSIVRRLLSEAQQSKLIPLAEKYALICGQYSQQLLPGWSFVFPDETADTIVDLSESDTDQGFVGWNIIAAMVDKKGEVKKFICTPPNGSQSRPVPIDSLSINPESRRRTFRRKY